MIDGPLLMILVGAVIQAVPPACALLIHIRHRAPSAPALGEPART